MEVSAMFIPISKFEEHLTTVPISKRQNPASFGKPQVGDLTGGAGRDGT